MKTWKQIVVTVTLTVAGLVLVGCASGPSVEGAPTAETRVVSIEDPRFVQGAGDCADSRIVADLLMSADMPASHLSYLLRADASVEDIQTLADCLRRALSSGRVAFD